MSEETYFLDDPRPIAAEAPYTFYLPSASEVAAVAPGDQVQLIFQSLAPAPKWGAERMWVTVESADGNRLEGRLDTIPDDMPGVALGDHVRFERHHVIGIIWGDDRTEKPPERPPPRREYLERCMVDRCIVDERVRVHYLYREAPDPEFEEGDEYPDSGWRIRGDYRGLTDAEMEERRAMYVGLAVVLNVDDSWLHLIDAPVGSAFIRDWENDRFVPSE